MTIDVNIPVKEYSIIDFPFKIKKVQFNSFTIEKKVVKRGLVIEKKKEDKTDLGNRIDLSKNNARKKRVTKNKNKRNILGLERGVNVLTFKPKYKGFFEMIVWGYKEFPMMIRVHITDGEDSEKYVHFVETRERSSSVKRFESMPHEKIIENITKYLYDRNNKKPSGYHDVIRREAYRIEIKNAYRKTIGYVKVSLDWETIGRNYAGQVWNVNIENADEVKKEMALKRSEEGVAYNSEEKEVRNNHETYKPIVIREYVGETLPDGFVLKIYPQLFDGDGVYGVSPESYNVTLAQGTRVMIVRAADSLPTIR